MFQVSVNRLHVGNNDLKLIMEAPTISLDETRPKLSEEQIERVIKAAEVAARKYIASRVSKHEIEDLNIAVEVEVDRELRIDVEVQLDTLSTRENQKDLVEGGVEAAHMAAKHELDKLKRS